MLWRGLKKKSFCCLNDRTLQTTLMPQQLSFSCPGKQTNQVNNKPIISLSQRDHHPKGCFSSVTQTIYSQTVGNTLHKKYCAYLLCSWPDDPQTTCFLCQESIKEHRLFRSLQADENQNCATSLTGQD